MCHKGDVDESMVPYFGFSGCGVKQVMQNKTLLSQLWSLNLEDAYLHAFNVYQGKTNSTDFELGRGVV